MDKCLQEKVDWFNKTDTKEIIQRINKGEQLYFGLIDNIKDVKKYNLVFQVKENRSGIKVTNKFVEIANKFNSKIILLRDGYAFLDRKIWIYQKFCIDCDKVVAISGKEKFIRCVRCSGKISRIKKLRGELI